MIWRILGIIGAGSFFVNGFSLLSDPTCVSADFGGGRVIQVTCRSDSFGTVTGTQAGLISLLLGTGIITLIFWREIRNLITSSEISSSPRNDKSSKPSVQSSRFNNYQRPIKSNRAQVGYKQCVKCKAIMRNDRGHCEKCLGYNFVDSTEEDYISMSDLTSIKICEGCETAVDFRWLVGCPQCGGTIFVHKQVPVEIQEVVPEFKTCPMCAEEIKFAAKKCRFCQHMIEI